MDTDKLKQWMDLAHKFDSGDFWRDIFGNGEEASGPDALDSRRKSDKLYPQADIFERGIEIWVLIELPGMRRQDVELTLAGGSLTVRGIVKIPLDNVTPLHTERFYGPFERTIVLPQLGDQSRVRARMDLGLLMIRYERMQRLDEWIVIE